VKFLGREQVDIEPRSWLDPRIEVRPSPIHGRGLFPTAAILPGETILVIGGEVMPGSHLQRLKKRESYSCMALDEATILVNSQNDPVIYGNHSCDPNLWMVGAVTEVARKHIARDEELTVDYAVMSDDPEWRRVCRCGAKNCRGVVTGLDWRRRELQERYAGHFSPFLDTRITLSALSQ
jgi:uncharacterized protein